MFSDWKIQLEKVKLTRDLKTTQSFTKELDSLKMTKDIAILQHEHKQHCMVSRRNMHCFSSSKTHARKIKFLQKLFIESIPYEEVHPDQIRCMNHKFRNIHNFENKLTRFQIYPETELACKYNKPIYKTQYSEIHVEYENGFDMNTGHLIVNTMATSHSITDENPYVSVNFQKNTGEKHRSRWKNKITQRNSL